MAADLVLIKGDETHYPFLGKKQNGMYSTE